ncbi:hypothetical protein PILCRDRAFT_825765 [Piloderma croceum F 1598]|uniref:Fungal N-terminal domain-containing protein n=1 Tax=Piloderma croceum (strain F 1598) TaxID=765440 RepID=A0A0C3ASU5_PILCF|nr:hypothetical protein PILCRDRAFT_825765 [Piloderma croceum F 1598]
MDIVLSRVPVPYLAHAFNVLRFILSSVEQVQASKQQLHALAQTAAQLLSTLNQEYHAGRLVHAETSAAVADLDRFLDEISIFAQKASRPFLTVLFTKCQRIAQIDQYHRRIGTAVTSFQISSLVSIRAWQVRNDDARVVDRQALDNCLTRLETNHQQLVH